MWQRADWVYGADTWAGRVAGAGAGVRGAGVETEEWDERI